MNLPPLIVAMPLLAAILLAVFTKVLRPRVADVVAIAAALGVSVMCGFLYRQSLSSPLVHWFGGWRPRGGVAVGISFVVDPAGAGLAVLVSVLMLAALVYSARYFEKVGTLYHTLMLVFLGAMCGFCLTGDLFNLFVFFELMGAAAYALCGYKTEEPGPLQGALNFAVVNTVGAFLVLDGLALLYARTGALNLAQIAQAVGDQRPDGLLITAFVLLAAGFLVKAAAVPFHFWLADAHAVAPTPVCILFSGVMVELGLYAVVRLYWVIFSAPFAGHGEALRALLITAGLLTALLGAVMCFLQRHIKRLLAFSTVSHVGIMLIGFGLLDREALAGLIVYVAGHALVKSSLFLGAGLLLHRFGSVDELKLHGRARRVPLLAGVFVLGAFGLAGLPTFGTFLGEALMSEAAEHHDYAWLSWCSMLAAALTGAAVLRMTARVFFGWGAAPDEAARPPTTEDEQRETRNDHTRLPLVMVVPTVLLAVTGLFSGLTPGAAGAAHLAAERLHDRPAYIARVLDDQPVPPPAPATTPALTTPLLHGLASAAAALILACLALFRPRLRLPGTVRGVAELRQVHSGHIGDYVAWLTLGVAVFGVSCAVLLR
ncbi:complex I subunit 5 family protein [Deinococcus sonorensis]|uniref:Proton-conducting transporter membrane subunit n=2 Tax=Deinococcus sonorensis TaxID=309891 RepID=A0AAU7U4X3_9DEIO